MLLQFLFLLWYCVSMLLHPTFIMNLEYLRRLVHHLMTLLNADTMMKFASFETVVEMIYKYAIPAPKSECSKNQSPAWSELCRGIHCWGVLCSRFSPSWQPCFLPQQCSGGNCRRCRFPRYLLLRNACSLGYLPYQYNLLLAQAVKKIGLVGLFTRGLPLRIVMIGTLTGAQWGIYDAFKVMVGL